MLSATLHEWKRKIEQLQQRWRGARQENERLRKENEVLRRREKQWESEREQWERERKRLERERERLRGEIDNLKRQLEEAQRANKRQAAPFSRGTRKEHPKTPGRKPGAAYGRRYCKLPPKQVDEVIPVPLPRRCSCGGGVTFDRTESQYQQEIVRKTIWLRFDNGIDETGWNVAAQLRWLWVAVSEQVTFCDILPGRGFDEAASILGADYKGWLTHDGWQVYYKFLKAGHQSCLNHLLDRAKKLIE